MARSISYGRSSTTSTPIADSTGSTSDRLSGRAGAEDLEPRLALRRVDRLVQRQRDRAASPRFSIRRTSPAATRGREVLLVGLGERVAVVAGQPGAGLLAELVVDRDGEVVGPRPGGVGQPLLQLLTTSKSRSVSPGAARTTKCSRASTDSLTRAV